MCLCKSSVGTFPFLNLIHFGIRLWHKKMWRRWSAVNTLRMHWRWNRVCAQHENMSMSMLVLKCNLWSAFTQARKTRNSPLRSYVPPLACLRALLIFFNYPTKLRKPQGWDWNRPIAVYLVGSSMLTLESWLRHLANPLRRSFQLQKLVFYIAQCSVNFGSYFRFSLSL